jgi:hypothetical protein
MSRIITGFDGPIRYTLRVAGLPAGNPFLPAPKTELIYMECYD